MSGAVVKVTILGDDASLKRTLNSSRAALSAWDKSLNKLGKSGAAMTSVGRNLTHGITVPVLAIAGASVKMAYDFDKAMTRIKTLTDGGAQNMDLYKKSILDLGKATGQTPTDLANGLYYIASSGFTGKKALDVLNVAAKGAAAGLGDTQTIADYATTALNVYGSATFGATDAVDLLVKAIKDGKGEPADFAAQLGKIMGSAKLAGIGIREAVGVVTELTNLGQPVDKATTSIDNILGVLAKPSAGGLKMFKTLGLDAKNLRQELKDKGLKETLDHINKSIHASKTIDPTTAVNTIFANKRASRGFNVLEGADQSKVNGVIKDVMDTKGALDGAFKTWSDSMQGKFHKAMGVLYSDLTALGGQILPKLVDELSKLTQWWSKLDPATKKQIEKFALLAATMGPLIFTFGKLLSSLSLIAKHPIVAALSILLTYFVKLYATNEQFRNAVNKVAGALADAVKWIYKHRDAIEAVLIPLGVAVGTYIAVNKAMKIWKATSALLATGQYVLAAAVWLVNAAMDANPVVLIIAGIAALVAAVIICYKKFDTFRYAVNVAVKAIASACVWLADKALLIFEKILEGWSHLPDWMGGGKANGAAKAVQGLRDGLQGIKRDIDSIPTSKTMEIKLNVTTATQNYNAQGFQGPALPKSLTQSSSSTAKIAGARASGGPVAGGNSYLVGEHGPEVVTMGQSGYVSTAAATAKMFGNIGKVSDSTSALVKTAGTQKTQYDNAARRYKQLLARPQHTQAQKDSVVNAKATMDQQKSDYDAAAKAVLAAQKADKALTAQYKKGAPLLTKAAGLVGFGDVVGPVEKASNALADQIRKQFADADGNIPAAAQAAIDRLNDLASKAASARSSLISSLTGDSDFVSQIQGGNTSTAGIQAFLTGQVNKIKALGNDLKILSSRGLPPSMLAQLAAGGLAALPIADALAAASSADLAGIVNTQSQINTLSNALGDATQSAAFGSPDSPTGNLTGTVIKDAPAGTVNNINITAQTNATAAQIAADAAWHLRTVSA